MKRFELSIDLEGSNTPRIKKIVVNRVILRLYSIGFLCGLCRVAPVTIRSWERQRFFPVPIFRMNTLNRWYSAVEIMSYKALLDHHYQSHRDRRQLYELLRQTRHRLAEEFKRLSPDTKKDYPDIYFGFDSHLEAAITRKRKGNVVQIHQQIRKEKEAAKEHQIGEEVNEDKDKKIRTK